MLALRSHFLSGHLYYACLYEHVDVFEFLLDHDVQLDVVDIQTDTALAYAIYNKNKHLMFLGQDVGSDCISS